MSDPLVAIIAFVIFIYSVVLHELAHGLAARSLGDPTAQYLGRLTLNPFSHLDPFGSVVLPLILYLAHSPFLFGYAKPVPYNPANLRDRRWGPVKVAMAGPATNLLLAVLFGLSVRLLGPVVGGATLTLSLLEYGVFINIVLALFNLMPIPPLDGHWLLMTLLPARYNGLKVALYQYQWVLVIGMVFFVFPLLTPFIGTLTWLLTGIRPF